MYVIGKTGMGKTNMLENLAIQDIRNGHGVCFIDPHGDSAEKLISMIPSERVNDVVYFNPGDQDFPIAFNVMEQVDPRFRPLVASGLIGVFQKLWADSWGPRLEYILRNAILALLEYPGSTLLGVMRILIDKKYRSRVINHISDPVVKAFWADEFSKWNERVLQEVISPIQNKVGQFLTSPLIRNVIGQTHSAFNVRDIMDQKKILIMNLAKGRIGEDNAALMGAMMITKIQLAAMGRVDIPDERDREDFYLYVDEFQNFATESFANILSEARKYRLNLILANQYIAQLEEPVRDAVFGNAGTIVSFRVGAADAEVLEKEFEPVFMMNDIVNLPKYQIYIKLMIDGIAGDAFSATTLPPIVRLEEDSTEKVIAVSRERYASKREDVEEKIATWSGMVTTPTATRTQHKQPTVERTSSQQSANAPAQKLNDHQDVHREVQRELYDATCSMCELHIQVPFKPDGKRPVYCKDCLKDYQRLQAKKEQHTTQKPHKTSSHPEKKTPAPEKKHSSKKQDDDTRQVTDAVYMPDQKPLSLHQMTHIAPKKFKKTFPKIDTKGIQTILKNAKKNVHKS